MFFIRKYRPHLKRWVSTVSIFFTHMQTIGIVGNLKLVWPPPVEAVTSYATLSVFESTETIRPECLLKEFAELSAFLIFSIGMAALILAVLFGSTILASLLALLRRLICGRAPAMPAGSDANQSYAERLISIKERKYQVERMPEAQMCNGFRRISMRDHLPTTAVASPGHA